MPGGIFNENYRCPLCHRLHAIRNCTRFIVMAVEEKLRVVAQNSLCYNCLAQSHTRPNCKCRDRCRRCGQDHHSWLHPLPEGRVWVRMTAVVRVSLRRGMPEVRMLAVIDPTVARSSITQRAASKLQCTINNGHTLVNVTRRNENDRVIRVECVVEDKDYGYSPERNLYGQGATESDEDANPRWLERRRYHLVLGADVQNRILLGTAFGKPGKIYLQETVFGYAWFGESD